MKTKPPPAPSVRFRVDPAYVPADKAARRMGLTLQQIQDCARQLYARGFPLPDETTGMYDLEAVDRWRKRQRPDLYPEVTGSDPAPEIARPKVDWGARFAEAEGHRREKRGPQHKRPPPMRAKPPS